MPWTLSLHAVLYIVNSAHCALHWYILGALRGLDKFIKYLFKYLMNNIMIPKTTYYNDFPPEILVPFFNFGAKSYKDMTTATETFQQNTLSNTHVEKRTLVDLLTEGTDKNTNITNIILS